MIVFKEFCRHLKLVFVLSAVGKSLLCFNAKGDVMKPVIWQSLSTSYKHVPENVYDGELSQGDKQSSGCKANAACVREVVVAHNT